MDIQQSPRTHWEVVACQVNRSAWKSNWILIRNGFRFFFSYVESDLFCLIICEIRS